MLDTEETTIRVQVRGTTVMAVYGVDEGAVVLVSADFGDAQAPLDGAHHHVIATLLLHNLAEAAMASGGDPFMPDDHQARLFPAPSQPEL